LAAQALPAVLPFVYSGIEDLKALAVSVCDDSDNYSSKGLYAARLCATYEFGSCGIDPEIRHRPGCCGKLKSVTSG
jgi:hypothetical protein